MRLLAPAVLLVFGGLVSPALESEASSLPNSTAQRQSQDIQGGSALHRDSAASLSNGAKQATDQTTAATSGTPAITIPAGTKVTLALTSPIWAKTAKPGDAVYAATAFPVASNGTMLIPPGTYVLGQIDAVTKPGWRAPRALLQMHFSKIIFASGYTVELADAPAQAATATVHVDVTSRNDVLLDNGAQFDMVVQTPLALDPARIAEAVRHSRPLPIGSAKSASLCRPIPATPGTPDTVIPGTPGSPGTPDTVIPGPNGTTTVIPGIPPTQGTPPTIIPGSPGTPEIPCPAPPAVVSGLTGPQIHRKSFQLASEVQVSGKKVLPGSYEVTWIGTATTAQVDLLQNGKAIVRAPARIAMLPEKSGADKVVTRANPDGSNSIASLEFAGENFSVIFD